jgi:haloacetate dehalogenase
MWHRVAPMLMGHYHLVIPDLRGYGASDKPAPDPEHVNYSKRAMAGDMAGLMTRLGHSHYGVLAHDRGARVAHRLALDHAEAVGALLLLDIAPTREMYAETGFGFARAYWHWFYLIQPAPMPERMISADPRAFWLEKCGAGSAGLDVFAPEALEAYLDAFDDPAAIAASCEDYRAGATIDIAHDDADGDRQLACPLRVLWGRNGAIEAHFDPLALWRQRARTVKGESLPGGHYLAEELPDEIAAQTLNFFERHLKS